MDAIKGETKGHLEDLLVALVTPPGHFDMQQVKKAIKVGVLRFLFCVCYHAVKKNHTFTHVQLSLFFSLW